ncbi:MAG: hypothetical protein ABII85_01785 [Bacillota bacterium]
MSDSKWKLIQNRLDEIKNWVQFEGLKEYEIIERIGISKTTWEKYKKERGILTFTLHEARKERGYRLVPKLLDALERVALGYEQKEAEVVETDDMDKNGDVVIRKKVTNKIYPPNVDAISRLLKNLTKDFKDPWTDQPMDIKIKEKRLELDKKAQQLRKNKDW